jgi:thioredoxin reductase (NADPH)
VYLIARGPEIKPEPINKIRVEQSSRIRVITRTNVVRIEGVKHVERVILDRPLEDKKKELALDAVFIAMGSSRSPSWPCCSGKDQSPRRDRDRPDSRTNVPGIYAAGDVADRAFKKAITGVAEGVIAAYSAYQGLKNDVILACDDEEAHPLIH